MVKLAYSFENPCNKLLISAKETMSNVTETYFAPFNIAIPENTHLPDQVSGTHRAGAHG